MSWPTRTGLATLSKPASCLLCPSWIEVHAMLQADKGVIVKERETADQLQAAPPAQKKR